LLLADDRKSERKDGALAGLRLLAILSSEAEAAERLANSIRTRTSTQRLKRLQAVERAARINRILLFFRHDETGPYISDADLALCKSLERKLIIRW
jgi:hypothetical protein